jgi:hypothetical protein
MICGIFGLIIIGLIFGKWALSEEGRQQFHHAMLVVNAVVFVAGTAWAFVEARRREMIQRPTVAAAAGLWMLATALAVIDLVLHQRSIPNQILLAGLAALTVAPVALTPLALAWNRHR